MPINTLLLTVWKPLDPSREIAVLDDRRAGFGQVQQDDLFVDAYSWRLREEPWSSTLDQEDAKRLRDALSGFAPYQPWERRTFGHVGDTVELFRSVLESGRTAWQETPQQVAGERDDDTLMRVNYTLAFYLHLRWLHVVFRDVPRANLTVR